MSTARMLHLVTCRYTPDPWLCARLLGELIHGARRLDDRPLEQIAPLAALTVDEWLAIEAGEAPDAWEQVLLIAQALHCGQSWLQYLAKLYQGATRP